MTSNYLSDIVDNKILFSCWKKLMMSVKILTDYSKKSLHNDVLNNLNTIIEQTSPEFITSEQHQFLSTLENCHILGVVSDDYYYQQLNLHQTTVGFLRDLYLIFP